VRLADLLLGQAWHHRRAIVRIRFSGESESVTMTINDPDIVLIARRKQASQ
jgi:hypothetical protein